VKLNYFVTKVIKICPQKWNTVGDEDYECKCSWNWSWPYSKNTMSFIIFIFIFVWGGRSCFLEATNSRNFPILYFIFSNIHYGWKVNNFGWNSSLVSSASCLNNSNRIFTIHVQSHLSNLWICVCQLLNDSYSRLADKIKKGDSSIFYCDIYLEYFVNFWTLWVLLLGHRLYNFLKNYSISIKYLKDPGSPFSNLLLSKLTSKWGI
jgi:hypothetical protein